MAYAKVTYETAYLKCHYPKAYMAALLTSVLDNSVKVAEYMAECREVGIRCCRRVSMNPTTTLP